MLDLSQKEILSSSSDFSQNADDGNRNTGHNKWHHFSGQKQVGTFFDMLTNFNIMLLQNSIFVI